MAKKKAAKTAPKAVKSKKVAPKRATAPKSPWTVAPAPVAPPPAMPAATAPSITTQPTAQTKKVGQTATFTVVATGTAPLVYQWFKNGGIVITSATNASYTTPALAVTDNGVKFKVRVTNAAGTVISNEATLTVTAPAREFNWLPIALGIVAGVAGLLIALAVFFSRPAAPKPVAATVAAITQTVAPAATATPAAKPTSTIVPTATPRIDATATKAPTATPAAKPTSTLPALTVTLKPATPIALPTDAPATATPPRGLASTATATLAATQAPATTPTQTAAPTEAQSGSAVTLDSIVENGKKPPFETTVQKDDRGHDVTTIKGFDLTDTGGDDTGCTRTELDAVALREEIGSPAENCKIVVEWSLKYQATTIVSGIYAMKPGEWFRIEGNVSGEDRFVGTLWYLPSGWASHMYAANIAAEWQPKNPGLVTIVGLSPTDPWVVGLAKLLAALPK